MNGRKISGLPQLNARHSFGGRFAGVPMNAIVYLAFFVSLEGLVIISK